MSWMREGINTIALMNNMAFHALLDREMNTTLQWLSTERSEYLVTGNIVHCLTLIQEAFVDVVEEFAPNLPDIQKAQTIGRLVREGIAQTHLSVFNRIGSQIRHMSDSEKMDNRHELANVLVKRIKGLKKTP